MRKHRDLRSIWNLAFFWRHSRFARRAALRKQVDRDSPLLLGDRSGRKRGRSLCARIRRTQNQEKNKEFFAQKKSPGVKASGPYTSIRSFTTKIALVLQRSKGQAQDGARLVLLLGKLKRAEVCVHLDTGQRLRGIPCLNPDT